MRFSSWAIIACNACCCFFFLLFFTALILFVTLKSNDPKYLKNATSCSEIEVFSDDLIVADSQSVVLRDSYYFIFQDALLYKPCGDNSLMYDVILEFSPPFSEESQLVSKFEPETKDNGLVETGIIKDCTGETVYSLEFQNAYYTFVTSAPDVSASLLQTETTKVSSAHELMNQKGKTNLIQHKMKSQLKATSDADGSSDGDDSSTVSSSSESNGDTSDSDASVASSSSSDSFSDTTSDYLLQSITINDENDEVFNYFIVDGTRMSATLYSADNETILASFTQYTANEPDYIIYIGDVGHEQFEEVIVFTVFGIWTFSKEKTPVNLCYITKLTTIIGSVVFGFFCYLVSCITWSYCKARRNRAPVERYQRQS